MDSVNTDDLNISYGYVIYWYRTDSIPDGPGAWSLSSKSLKSFTQGSIEFTRIDKRNEWVNGKLDVDLFSDTPHAMKLQGKFRLYTEFMHTKRKYFAGN
ncbi:hypothetical protein [Parabacteroides pacaensis]|uniref:hypothetical protein n=1 Tax=Parabacteroides pacaensis TaxID=2086575 RepID=UPI00131C99F6|nr:hypothetical protein [Parabacteroides pacaensis]